MIERIRELPDDVLGFTAKGEITADDYASVIIPAVEAQFARHDEDFSGFEAAAMWDDTRLGLKHLAGRERMALVSDVELLRVAVKISALAIPGHVRVFHHSELAAAKEWIAG